jgi:hypothetical protein
MKQLLPLAPICFVAWSFAVGKTRAHGKRAAGTHFLSCPAKRGRGTVRRTVEGASTKRRMPASTDAHSTTLRVVPLPHFVGADEKRRWFVAQTVPQAEAGAGRIRTALCRRESVAATALLRRVQAVAGVRLKSVPEKRRLPRRCAPLPQARARARAASGAMAGAANDSRGDAGEYRRAGARGAAMHAARFLCVASFILPR